MVNILSGMVALLNWSVLQYHSICSLLLIFLDFIIVKLVLEQDGPHLWTLKLWWVCPLAHDDENFEFEILTQYGQLRSRLAALATLNRAQGRCQKPPAGILGLNFSVDRMHKTRWVYPALWAQLLTGNGLILREKQQCSIML